MLLLDVINRIWKSLILEKRRKQFLDIYKCLKLSRSAEWIN